MEDNSVTDKHLATKEKAVKGVMWTSASFYSGKMLVLISTVILARLLSQDDFGIAGYAIVVISLMDVLSDLGVGASLIYYHEDPDAADTAFWLGMGISIFLLVVLWLGAPLMGIFFNDARAVPVIRALAFYFPLSALGNIHDSLLSKELSFGKKFVPDLARAFGKGMISILFAIFGFGAWSLIIGQLVSAVISTIALWWVFPWRPSLRYVHNWVRPLLGYGGKTVVVAILGAIIGNTDYLLIGRFLGAEALGVYTLAFRIPDMLITQMCNLISRVTFPLYTKLQDDHAALVKAFLDTTRYISLITIPLGLGIALVAQPMVLVIFGEKWAEAIPVVQAIAIYTIFQSLFYSAGIIYKAQGRPEVLSYLAFLHVVILVPAVYWAVTVPRSITAVGWTLAVVVFCIGILEIAVASCMLKTPVQMIALAAAPAVINGGFLAVVVWVVLFLLRVVNPMVQLAIGVSSGMIVYLAGLWIFSRDLVINTIHAFRSGLQR